MTLASAGIAKYPTYTDVQNVDEMLQHCRLLYLVVMLRGKQKLHMVKSAAN